jgi:hypothetical protein
MMLPQQGCMKFMHLGRGGIKPHCDPTSLRHEKMLTNIIKSIGTSCGWQIQTMSELIRTSSIGNRKETTLTSEVSRSIHCNVFYHVHMNEWKLLPTNRTHPSRWHKVGSQKFPTLVPNVQYEFTQTCNNRIAPRGLSLRHRKDECMINYLWII